MVKLNLNFTHTCKEYTCACTFNACKSYSMCTHCCTQFWHVHAGQCMKTHYTQEMIVTSVHFTSHVHYTCGVATVNVDHFIQYCLKFLMNGRVYTEYAMIIDSTYLYYDMGGPEPIRSCCIVQKLSACKC